MQKPLGKIKVYFKNDPTKIIAFLKNVESKEVTLDKIRTQIPIMKENHLFVEKGGDVFGIGMESEATLEDILDEKNLKIFISDSDSSNQENKEEQSQQGDTASKHHQSIKDSKEEKDISSHKGKIDAKEIEEINNNPAKNKFENPEQLESKEQTKKEDKPEIQEIPEIKTNNDKQSKDVENENDIQSQEIIHEKKIKNNLNIETNPENQEQQINLETKENDQNKKIIQENQVQKETKEKQESPEDKSQNQNEPNQIKENSENINETQKEFLQKNKENDNPQSQNPDKIINKDNNFDQNQINKDKNSEIKPEENNKNNQKDKDLNNQANEDQSREIFAQKKEKENENANESKEKREEMEEKKDMKENKNENNTDVDHNINSKQNEDLNSEIDEVRNKKDEKKLEKEQDANTNKKENQNRKNKNVGTKMAFSQKTKIYFFTAIINTQFSEKIEFEFRRNGQNISFSMKTTQTNFENIIIPKLLLFKSTLNRKLYLYEVTIPADINSLQLIIKNNNKEYTWGITTGNSTNFLTINLKPFNEIKGLGDNIFYNLETEKEKELFLLHLINYFKEKDIAWKKKFIDIFMVEQNIRPIKKFSDIFYLIDIFDNNFLDSNFSPIFTNIEKFNYDNQILITQDISDKIFKLYNDIRVFKNKEEINKEIWPFLILYLMKMKEANEVLDILSLIEKLKNFREIIKLLFSRIKKLITLIPEIKDYFVYLLKYQPTELDFMTKNINDYNQYIFLIVSNIKEIKDKIFHIFPSNLRNNIDNSANVLHNIIKIIKEKENNLIFDCQIFKNIILR